MKTYPIVDPKKSPYPFAFEIENAYLSRRAVARLLGRLDGVTDVVLGGGYWSLNDVRVAFKYRNRDYIVWEPFGDNSRYWIGPKDSAGGADDITAMEDFFKQYQPPLRSLAITLVVCTVIAGGAAWILRLDFWVLFLILFGAMLINGVIATIEDRAAELDTLNIDQRIQQSSVRVNSGLRLTGFLLLVAGAAFVFGVLWLAKLGGVAAGFFALVTLLEYRNVRRLESRRMPPAA